MGLVRVNFSELLMTELISLCVEPCDASLPAQALDVKVTEVSFLVVDADDLGGTCKNHG